MKLKNLVSKWSFMPQNAFDHKTKEQAYIDLYEYACRLEEHIKINRADIRLYKREICCLNKALLRKIYGISKLRIWKEKAKKC